MPTTEIDREARIIAAEDVTAPERHAIAGGTAFVVSVRSPVRETPNEDAAALVPLGPTRGVLAVADGVGGQAAGADAAALAMHALVARLQQRGEGDPTVRTAILNGFETANGQILERGVGAGTTLAVVEIDGATIRPYHVGDSEILVVGQRGKTRLQTLSHSPVGYAVESGMLDAADALHHEDRHIVSNIVGSPEMRIDMGPIVTLQPRDTVLLASDGVFDNLHNNEVIELIRKGSLPGAARAVAAACRQRMMMPEPGSASKMDDLTFILYRSQTS